MQLIKLHPLHKDYKFSIIIFITSFHQVTTPSECFYTEVASFNRENYPKDALNSITRILLNSNVNSVSIHKKWWKIKPAMKKAVLRRPGYHTNIIHNTVKTTTDSLGLSPKKKRIFTQLFQLYKNISSHDNLIGSLIKSLSACVNTLIIYMKEFIDYELSEWGLLIRIQRNIHFKERLIK